MWCLAPQYPTTLAHASKRAVNKRGISFTCPRDCQSSWLLLLWSSLSSPSCCCYTLPREPSFCHPLYVGARANALLRLLALFEDGAKVCYSICSASFLHSAHNHCDLFSNGEKGGNKGIQIAIKLCC